MSEHALLAHGWAWLTRTALTAGALMWPHAWHVRCSCAGTSRRRPHSSGKRARSLATKQSNVFWGSHRRAVYTDGSMELYRTHLKRPSSPICSAEYIGWIPLQIKKKNLSLGTFARKPAMFRAAPIGECREPGLKVTLGCNPEEVKLLGCEVTASLANTWS